MFEVLPDIWVQLHHPRFLEFIRVPESARLLYHSLTFVTSMHRMSAEMMTLGMGHVVFHSEEVVALSTTPTAPRAAKYMAAMGLWHPQTGPGEPRPVPASSCNACMNFRYCFPEGPI